MLSGILQKRFLAIGLIVLGLLGVGLLWYLVLGQGLGTSEQRVYTADDFPNVGSVIQDPTVIAERIAYLNQWYDEIYNDSEADVAFNYNRIGVVKKTLQDYVGAEQAWLKALELNKSSLNWANLASLYYLELGQPQKAIDYFTQAILVNPNNPPFYEDLAGVYRYKLGNDSQKVEEVMLYATTNDPFSANNYYLYLLEYYESDGQNQEKFDHYLELLLDNDPSELQLQNLRQNGWL